MVFDRYGNLKGSIITDYTLEDIQSHLVTPFHSSKTRLKIFQSFTNFIKDLDNRFVYRIWIDGSFCTNKENPNDIDCLIFLKPSIDTPDYFDKLRTLKIDDVDQYAMLDKYFSPAKTPGHISLLNQEKYWMGQFGFDRQRRHKAIIELQMEDLL